MATTSLSSCSVSFRSRRTISTTLLIGQRHGNVQQTAIELLDQFADIAADLVVLVQFAFTFIAVEAALSIAPMFGLLAEEFHLTQTQLNLLSGSCILAQGFANILIVPYSNIFGRRQASLTFAVLIILTEVWEALATSYKSLLAARVLNGLTTAISETVMVQVINDLFFLHERGTWMGIYL